MAAGEDGLVEFNELDVTITGDVREGETWTLGFDGITVDYVAQSGDDEEDVCLQPGC